jgi:phage virion morphogenesis protein
MTSLKVSVDIDDRQVRDAFLHMASAGADLSPAMREIGAALESSTQRRFETETDPDGMRWVQSLRAREEGGQTLTDSARLRNSITWEASRDAVQVGTNVIYGAVHQFGAFIRAKGAGYLKFKIGDRWTSKKAVSIRPRPFLGISAGDRDEIVEILRGHLLPPQAEGVR